MLAFPLRSLAIFSATLVTVFGAIAAPRTTSAADIDVSSQIDAVTVFPTGAEILRTFSVELDPGEHVLNILLPYDVQQNSIQVEETSGRTVSINSLDLRSTKPDTREKDLRYEALKSEIAVLNADIGRYKRRLEDTALAHDLVKTLAQRRLQPSGQETTPPVPDPSELTLLLDMLDERLSRISEATLDAEARIAEARRAISERQDELSKPRETGMRFMRASVHVVSPDKGLVSFALRYRLSTASWQPVYEARLTTGATGQAAQLELVRKALVAQGTTEDWNNVELTISSAQRTSRMMPPLITPLSLQRFTREKGDVQPAKAAKSITTTSIGATAPQADAEERVEQMQAAARVTGFNVQFDIPGRVTIDRSGSARTVRIAALKMPAELALAASPKIDLTAYLVARFAVKSEAPLLPGRVLLFRDGVFVGEESLPLTAQGDFLELGFGIDDLVRIERHEVASQSGETGLVSTAYIEERSFLTRIWNGHSFAIPITIDDQTPVTDDERIRVDFLPGTARPDLEDVDGRPGVHAWKRTLQPNATEEISFGFRVTWPRGITR